MMVLLLLVIHQGIVILIDLQEILPLMELILIQRNLQEILVP